MVFGAKGAPAVGAKDTIINMIINSWLTFPFVDMTWSDSDGKYHILSWVSNLEIIPIFIIKQSILINYIIIIILIISYNKI